MVSGWRLMEKKNFSKKILIISSNFYTDISKNLQEGVLNVLKNEKIDFELKTINGSLEIPFFLEKYKRQFLGYIIIGCVIKGETDHYDIVKNITFSQIYKIAYENILPLSCALLTVENYSQALERSDTKKKNLGGLAAKTCLNLIKKINE
mgnify:CR=1 FL=1